MGSCVSFSRSPPAAASTAEERSTTQRQRAPVATAKVVNLDGSMAQFAGPVTAREAMLELSSGGGHRRAPSSPPLFLCGSDELRFDAPARALAADEALQPGQLYFALPARMLRRPLSGDDMAALAVRAAMALAAEAGLAAGGGGAMSPQRRRTKQGGAAGKGRRRQSTTARVAPLLFDSGDGKDDGPSDGSWSNFNDTRGGGLATRQAAVVHDDGSRTVGKARRRRAAAYRNGAARRRPGVQRLSAIAEDDE